MEDTTSSGSNENDRPEEENLERLSNLSWYVSLYFILLLQNFDKCSCGNCEIMPTVTECLCCCEIEVIAKKRKG